MMLHPGPELRVPLCQLVALVDLDRDPCPEIQRLLSGLKSAGRLKNPGAPAKALVLFLDKGETFGCLSPLSVRTLARRAQEKTYREK